ncbi:uncharacterized protein LOC111680453 [Lucilia cuprina]|nr:uncharacterized protein LOC111680453 [Lucilia cuprina]
MFYSESDEEKKDELTLDLVLLNFPTKHRRRQAIRQAEDKMASLSGILGLFMGLSFISILEYFYLTCRAFYKSKKSKLLEVATTAPMIQNSAESLAADRSVRGLRRQIIFQP